MCKKKFMTFQMCENFLSKIILMYIDVQIFYSID